VSVLLAILTIAVSGVVAAVVAYAPNATKEHVFFMRQKAEALYLAIERYDRSLGSHFLPYYRVIKNEIGYNELLDRQIKDYASVGCESADGLDATTSLVNIYFLDLRPHLDRYTAARDTINALLVDHKRACKPGDTGGTPWFKPLHEAMQDLNTAAEAFKEAIVAEARDLAPAERLWPQAFTLASVRSVIKGLS